MMAIDVGSVLGPVELKSVIRKDETSTVYAGHHARLGAEVTLRVIRGCPDDDRPRFLREARIAATLKHPALVRVLDFGEFGSARYIVTQPIRGTTLEHYLAEHKEPPSEAAILQLLLQVADTLRVCHAAGVAHRDLRPSSLLRDLKGRLKVLDFGLVPATGCPARTPDGSFVGISPYLPPEYAHCEAAMPASADVFALGVIAYKLAFRCLPYDPERLATESSDQLPPAPAFDLPTHCSEEFLDIVRVLIDPDPTARIDSAKELLDRLRAHPLVRSASIRSSLESERGERACSSEVPSAQGDATQTHSARTAPGALASVAPERRPATEEAPRTPQPPAHTNAWLGAAKTAATEIALTLKVAFYIVADQHHELASLPPATRKRVAIWGAALGLITTSTLAAGLALALS